MARPVLARYSQKRGREDVTALANLYLIGAPKAGTTSLATWLSQHPDVYWPTPKEPFYWASDFPRQRRHHGFHEADQYRQLFDTPAAQAASWRGDGSTTYLYSSVAIPNIVEQVGPEARFIVVFRDPVELVVSYHRTQLLALNENEPDFARAWSRTLAGGSPDSVPLDPKLLDYVMVGSQGAAFQRILQVVPRERIHPIIFDDLRDDPASVWQGLTNFLGLSMETTPEFIVENKSQVNARFPALRRLVHRPPRLIAAPIAKVRMALGKSSSPLLRALRSKLWREAPRPQVDSSTREELRRFFADDVALLEQLLARTLTWR